jgi:hypothetical protein
MKISETVLQTQKQSNKTTSSRKFCPHQQNNFSPNTQQKTQNQNKNDDEKGKR